MRGRARTVALRGLFAAVAIGCAFPAGAAAEQASQPASAAAGWMDIGRYHACAVVAQVIVRCWGYGGDGALGYGNTNTIGDDETPLAAGPVDLGEAAVAVSAGTTHTCALLKAGSVRCWGFNYDGQLGYGNQITLGDNEPPGGPVDLGRPAVAIAAGRSHTCAILDNGTVRCWGFGFDGRLGYGNTTTIGDDELPTRVGVVNLGVGRTATAITAGDSHTCALLNGGSVRCWGFAGFGQLGYGNTTTFSDTQTPDTAGPIQFEGGLGAVAISAGSYHTCALLSDRTVRCWGLGLDGRLGYANTNRIGDDETLAAVGPVDLGRPAVSISAGADHTCALLNDGTVRCWGAGRDGQLGYGNTANIGDDETPSSAGPIYLGAGRTAVSVTAGDNSTCARLDDDSVRCWGTGRDGELGYACTDNVGDDELPGSYGPLDLGEPGITGSVCPPRPLGAFPGAVVSPPAAAPVIAPAPAEDGLAAQRRRARALRDCRANVARRLSTQQHRARSLPASKRAAASRRSLSSAARLRRACVTRYARSPGLVTSVGARASGRRALTLSFRASGTDGARPPAARRYLVKQSLRPIRTADDFRRAHALCKGSCSFDVVRPGTTVNLRVTDLLPRAYYYAVSARDNVTARAGPRSKTVTARAR